MFYNQSARSSGSKVLSDWANLLLSLEFASDGTLICLIKAMILRGFDSEDAICDLACRMGGCEFKDRLHALLARHEQDSVGAKLWHRHSDGHYSVVAADD